MKIILYYVNEELDYHRWELVFTRQQTTIELTATLHPNLCAVYQKVPNGKPLPKNLNRIVTSRTFSHKKAFVGYSPENWRTLLDINLWPKEYQLINDLKRVYQSWDGKTLTQTQIFKKTTLEFWTNETPQGHSIKTTDEFHSLSTRSDPSSIVSTQC